MGELLQNILNLREEINKLTELSNEKAYECCELIIKIADNKEDISIMSSEKKSIEIYIKDFKYNKSLLYSLPIGILFGISYCTYQLICNLYSLTFGYSIIQILGSVAMGMTLSVASACLLLRSDKFKNFLVKKYPSFNYMNDKLNNLIIEIKAKDKELIDIKKKEKEMTNAIINGEELLERKRDELNKLEEEYFNNLFSKPITNGTIYNVSSASKKLTLTRGNDYR